jgi:hypothetical protein
MRLPLFDLSALIDTPGTHLARRDKSQTYRVEGDNAEVRHYLARLVRRPRCFSRSLQALRRAIQLFVYAWNRRQLYKQMHPTYPAHLMEFVCPYIIQTLPTITRAGAKSCGLGNHLSQHKVNDGCDQKENASKRIDDAGISDREADEPQGVLRAGIKNPGNR